MQKESYNSHSAQNWEGWKGREGELIKSNEELLPTKESLFTQSSCKNLHSQYHTQVLSWGCPGSWTKEWLWGHVEGKAAFLSRCWGVWIALLKVGIWKKTGFLSLKEVEQGSQHIHAHMLWNSFLAVFINLNLFISIYSISSTVLNVGAVWTWIIMSKTLWSRPPPILQGRNVECVQLTAAGKYRAEPKVGWVWFWNFHSAPLWDLGFLQVKHERAAFT